MKAVVVLDVEIDEHRPVNLAHLHETLEAIGINVVRGCAAYDPMPWAFNDVEATLRVVVAGFLRLWARP